MSHSRRKIHNLAAIPCTFPGCTAGPFRNTSGLGSHITARHRVAVPPPQEQRARLAKQAEAPMTETPITSPPPSPPPHQNPAESAPPSTSNGNTEGTNEWHQLPGGRVRYHPVMNGRPCDKNGNFLDPGAPPCPEETPPPADNDWKPFDSRESFLLADLLYRKGQVSAPFINELLDIWAMTLAHTDTSDPPFVNAKDVYETIDDITHESAPWESFTMSFDGNTDSSAAPPEWQTAEYEVFFRCPRDVLHAQLRNTSYASQMDFAPKQVYNNNKKRTFSDYMSGNHPWRQANKLSEAIPEAEGATYCPLIFGSDKTTVSVATGQNDFYPLYMSNGLVHNTVRRGHRGAVTLIGFLAIPKSVSAAQRVHVDVTGSLSLADKEHHDSAMFRSFRRQLFHVSLRYILQSLKPGMTKPEIVRYGDGHYRKTMYGIGPYIADYPEQVLLACIVQGWCPRCTAHADDLDGPSTRRARAHTDILLQTFDTKQLWDDYGVISDCLPFTNDFPYADIHELLTSDLLHQCVKGTFKDHLITWLFEWLELEHGKAADERIIADIDRRIAAVPHFPGLQRFPQGRGFKQWTGDDSKALMKVILPAIEGYVPPQMLRAVSAFLEFCYLVRSNSIDEDAIIRIQDALERFHRDRIIFEREGVRPEGGCAIPRQHSLVHYIHVIQEFGALNGLCSSIAESAHIRAVKRPWRCSNRYNALRQMLIINERIDKLSACRTDFEARGMLPRAHPTSFDLPLPSNTQLMLCGHIQYDLEISQEHFAICTGDLRGN